MGIIKFVLSIKKIIAVVFIGLFIISIMMAIPEILGEHWLAWLIILAVMIVNFGYMFGTSIRRETLDNLIQQFPKSLKENQHIYSLTEEIRHEVDNQNEGKASVALLSNIIIIFILLFSHSN